MFELNPLHALDSYKLGHPFQYPEKTECVYSNFTPRSDRLSGIPAKYNDHKFVWFGLQGTIMEMVSMWQTGFFDKPLEEVLAVYKRRTPAFTGDNNPDMSRIVALHKLGYLPLHIKSLPEGSRVDMGVPVFTIKNTRTEFGWLTNSTETYLSNESWKPATVATIAKAYRTMLEHYCDLTGADPSFIDWQAHCFADRGMSGMMDAAKSCAGHSTIFLGSDSVSSVDWLEYAYGAKDTFVSGSVPATEHSVMCIGGNENELETIRRLVKDIYPSGVVSVVSDSWDFWKVISEYALILKEEILSRVPNEIGLAKVVFRPDSGNPVDVICGIEIEDMNATGNLEEAKYFFEEDLVERAGNATKHGEMGPDTISGMFRFEDQVYKMVVGIEWNRHDKQYYYIDGYSTKSCEPVTLTPEQKGAVECLWDIFGGTETAKGFKVLNQRVGLIYGDSITLERGDAILSRLAAKGFASSNIVLGIGSYTYQYLTRDTFGNAMKATYAIVDGQEREIFKDPITDIGKTKKSAKGLLRVEKEGDKFVLYDQQTPDQENQGELQTIFLDGGFSNTTTLEEIRERVKK
jgi:nicotinamide phosphoribosyltransferase